MDPTLDPTQWYKSIAGIVIATGLIVQVLKRLLGGNFAEDSWPARIPTWVYSVLVACVLTYGAHYAGVLVADEEASVFDLLMKSVVGAAIASGFFSWYNSAGDQIQNGVTFTKKGPIALLLAVSMLGATACGPTTSASARSTAVRVDTVVAESIFAVQDVEDAAYRAGLVDGEFHREFNRRLLPLLQAGQRFNRTIRAWDPSQPMPAEVRQMIPQFKQLLDHVVASLTAGETKSGLLEKIAIAQAAVLAALNFLPGDGLSLAEVN